MIEHDDSGEVFEGQTPPEGFTLEGEQSRESVAASSGIEARADLAGELEPASDGDADGPSFDDDDAVDEPDDRGEPDA